MKLSQLLSLYPQLKWGDDPTVEVIGVTADSRQVQKGSVFVAVKGLTHDGHKYLPEVVKAGAVGLVVEEEDNIPEDFSGAVVSVANTREALDQMASRFQDYPAEKLFCVGVTGTNGKTSVTYMVEALLKHFGWKTGVLGTIDHHLDNTVWESQLTTPDAVTLHKRLSEMRALGAEAVAFEVSSHALKQNRADNIPFDAVVFTNLTRDHLDYHDSMDDYFNSKQRLFQEILVRNHDKASFAIINGDDLYGRKLQVAGNAHTWVYGEKKGDFHFNILKENLQGTEFRVTTPRGDGLIQWPLVGRHNVYNAVAAIAVAMAAGASIETCAEALAKFNGVPGRLQPIPNDRSVHIFVDYAHTDDALVSVLQGLNELRQKSGGGRIITVFGCGGDRDRGKRPLMMKAAFNNSDKVFLTSDNPRTEDPQAIISDCLQGLSASDVESKVRVEVDRRKAIGLSLDEARVGDVILIAGKGHEDYQIIGTEKLPFSDAEVVKEIVI